MTIVTYTKEVSSAKQQYLCLGAKTNIEGGNHSSLPLTLTLLLPQGRVVNIFCAKMSGKDDPTISCSHLMVELSVLAGWKIILKGEMVSTPPPSVDEG